MVLNPNDKEIFTMNAECCLLLTGNKTLSKRIENKMNYSLLIHTARECLFEFKSRSY